MPSGTGRAIAQSALVASISIKGELSAGILRVIRRIGSSPSRVTVFGRVEPREDRPGLVWRDVIADGGAEGAIVSVQCGTSSFDIGKPMSLDSPAPTMVIASAALIALAARAIWAAVSRSFGLVIDQSLQMRGLERSLHVESQPPTHAKGDRRIVE
jgi:hypothetical protein